MPLLQGCWLLELLSCYKKTSKKDLIIYFGDDMIKKISKLLKGIFTKCRTEKRVNAACKVTERINNLVYSLEAPQFHLLKVNAINSFSGMVFDCNSKGIKSLNVYHGNKMLGSFGVDGLSNDIYDHVPHIYSAQKCRFEFDLYINADANKYIFEVVYDNDATELVFEYDVAEVRSVQGWLKRMSTDLAHIPAPNADLVYLTQGIRGTNAYQNSIVPGVYNIKRYLANSGIEVNRLGSILDFGCGTGRLLVGWYLDNSTRDLCGCDINRELVSWARNNLPGRIDWHQTSLTPELPYASKRFDLIYLVSVFTHLSLASQKSWIQELKRILRPCGLILITLHGEMYVRVFQRQRIEEFHKTGYIETANSHEGTSSFGTYHTFEFARKLFDDFEIVGYYPRGSIDNVPIIFPLAAFQDVYVLKCRLS